MTNGFPGIPAAGLEFLRDLESHNTKEWFQERKSDYEQSLRRPMLALLEALDRELARFAPAYRVAEPRKALSRPNRDTRFSADKRPYRTDISAVLPRGGGRKQEVAGFFFSVAPAGVDVVGGAYMPAPAQLKALREHLVSGAERFRRVVGEVEAEESMGTLLGERLKRVPREFSADDPAADLARYKQLFFRARLPPEVALSKHLLPELSSRFRLMTPFVELLDEGLAGASACRPRRDGASGSIGGVR